MTAETEPMTIDAGKITAYNAIRDIRRQALEREAADARDTIRMATESLARRIEGGVDASDAAQAGRRILDAAEALRLAEYQLRTLSEIEQAVAFDRK